MKNLTGAFPVPDDDPRYCPLASPFTARINPLTSSGIFFPSFLRLYLPGQVGVASNNITVPDLYHLI